MSDAETGTPASRLKGARKQLRLALEANATEVEA